MIKILFLIPNLAHGGAERVLVNLVNNLDPSTFEITLQTLFDEGINKQHLSSNIIYTSFLKHQFRGNSHLMKFFSPKFLYRVIVKKEYDVIVSYLEGPVARIISGCPFGDTKKIAWFHTAPESEKVFSVGFLFTRNAINTYSSMDKFVCVSKGVANAVRNIVGYQLENMVVKYNTIDSKKIREMANEELEDDRFNYDGLKICSVGKLQDVKGFDRLAKAHKRLKEKGICHRVYILGAGEQEQALKKYIEKNKLQNSFLLLGFQSNPYKYMASCDLYVCSSRREGFSSAVAEALILGLPVVSTDCSGTDELLGENSEYGVVVENSVDGIYSGLKLLLSDEEQKKYYTAKARERGKAFEIGKTVKAVESMILEVYNNGR